MKHTIFSSSETSTSPAGIQIKVIIKTRGLSLLNALHDYIPSTHGNKHDNFPQISASTACCSRMPYNLNKSPQQLTEKNVKFQYEQLYRDIWLKTDRSQIDSSELICKTSCIQSQISFNYFKSDE
jgi:hypothetical protein